MAIVVGLTLSSVISISKNIFCLAVSSPLFLRWLLLPHARLPPRSGAGDSLVNVIVMVVGAVAVLKRGEDCRYRWVCGASHRALSLKMWIEEIMGSS